MVLPMLIKVFTFAPLVACTHILLTLCFVACYVFYALICVYNACDFIYCIKLNISEMVSYVYISTIDINNLWKNLYQIADYVKLMFI